MVMTDHSTSPQGRLRVFQQKGSYHRFYRYTGIDGADPKSWTWSSGANLGRADLAVDFGGYTWEDQEATIIEGSSDSTSALQKRHLA